MSSGIVLSTSFVALQTRLLIPAAIGSNWIVARIQILMEAMRLAHILDESITPPTKLEPPADGASPTELAKYNTTSEKYWEYHQSAAELRHLVVPVVPGFLLVKALGHLVLREASGGSPALNTRPRPNGSPPRCFGISTHNGDWSSTRTSISSVP